ncbi:MAG: apolipoprotein N-acyltransferase [Puniceicoccaceae bacterium]
MRLSAVLGTALLRFALFPPVSFAEAAYFFLVPVLLVDWTKARLRAVFAWGWLGGFLFWIASIVWLRHVTVAGTLGLAAILGLFFALWLTGWSRWFQGRRGWGPVLGAAALWVLLEWARGWIFWGFPWNPLSVSQWNRPAVLTIVGATGGWGLSFLLVCINVALARWIREPYVGWRSKGFLPFARSVPLPLVVPLGILLLSSAWYFAASFGREESAPVRIGFVQPYATMKWDEAAATENLRELWAVSRSVAADSPDVILWPESATPFPVIGNEGMRAAVEELARETGVPLLMGNMAFHPGENVYENGVFRVDPRTGLDPVHYAKRHLVPFGEFIPFRRYLPFLEKVVPIGLDCRPGGAAVVFPLADDSTGERVAPLVCYEDVFPSLSRDGVEAGADWLFVATNNVWYGEEAGAYQHAAHAVLRAVETRRPVLRCGNAGWSGWIDEWGRVRRMVADRDGSIYFRGGEVVEASRDLRFDGYRTPYVRFGDWFVAACALVLALVLATAKPWRGVPDKDRSG